MRPPNERCKGIFDGFSTCYGPSIPQPNHHVSVALTSRAERKEKTGLRHFSAQLIIHSARERERNFEGEREKKRKEICQCIVSCKTTLALFRFKEFLTSSVFIAHSVFHDEGTQVQDRDACAKAFF